MVCIVQCTYSYELLLEACSVMIVSFDIVQMPLSLHNIKFKQSFIFSKSFGLKEQNETQLIANILKTAKLFSCVAFI